MLAQTNPELRLIALVRVSTQGQADEGTPETQRAIIRRIAQREGVTEDRLTWVEVSNVSGGNWTATPEWRRHVEPFLSDPNVHIACYHPDRVCRATKPAELEALYQILSSGTLIYHPMGVKVPSPDGDFTIDYLEGLLAGREKLRIKQRTWDAKEDMRRSGQVPDPRHLPLGVTYDRESQKWSYTEDAEIVRRAFEMFVVDGIDNLSAIGRACGGVHASRIAAWMRNPLYRGVRVIDHWARGEYVPGPDGRQGTHKLVPRPKDQIIRVRVFDPADQLIDDETWRAANARLDQRAGKRRAARSTNLDAIWLTGFMWSAHERLGPQADGWITLDLSRPAEHVVYGASGYHGLRYHCACKGTRNRLEKCGFRHLEAGVVNRALDNYLTAMCTEGWFTERVRAGGSTAKPKKDERPILEAQIQAVERKLARLADLYLDEKISRVEHDKRHDGLTTERSRLQAALDALGTLPVVDQQAVEDALAAMTWDAGWMAEAKRDWMARYRVRVRVSNTGVESVSLRFAGANGLPTYVLTHPRTWEQLAGVKDPADARSRSESEGYYGRAEAVAYLGVSVARWRYWNKRSYLPAPDRMAGKRGEWHRDTLESLRGRFKL